MIRHLHIANYALIDKLDIDFADGLTIITGETGAGKSIILGALSLLLGERAEVKAIRDGEQKTVVEALVEIKDRSLKVLFEDNDVDWVDHECVLRREISVSGRSRAFINDTPVPIGVMKELATRLIDIHSQHSNMLLSKSTFQLSILDSIAENETLLTDYGNAYRELNEVKRQLNEAETTLAQAQRDEDYIRFQVSQLQELALQPDEDKLLEAEHKKLSNASQLKEDLWQVNNELDVADNAILVRLSVVEQRLRNAQESLTELQDIPQRVQSAIIDLNDISRSVNTLIDTLNDDPTELARVEQRLGEIYALTRKHHVEDVNALLQLQHHYEDQLNALAVNDERIEQLKQEFMQAQIKANRLAEQLSSRRQIAGQHFAEELKRLAKPLGMKNLSLEAKLSRVELNASGCDQVELMMSFNKNQTLVPVKDTASGGEISRVMLCIKTIIARRMQLPTIIFDEVDTGVSGDVANRVGEMMADIARSIQVITITHLPQVAAHGNHHLKVYKSDQAQETLTAVQWLDEEEHVTEIARLLSGRDLNQAAIDNARSLIQSNKKN